MSDLDIDSHQHYGPDAYKDEDVLRELYHEKGLSLREVADVLGVVNSTVYNWMDRHGIDFRSKKEARPGGVSFHFDVQGYPHLSISHGTSTSQLRVHQLVAIAAGADSHKVFSEGDYHVHHINGMPSDNRPSNLAVVRSGDHIREHGLPEGFYGPHERHPDGRWKEER